MTNTTKTNKVSKTIENSGVIAEQATQTEQPIATMHEVQNSADVEIVEKSAKVNVEFKLLSECLKERNIKSIGEFAKAWDSIYAEMYPQGVSGSHRFHKLCMYDMLYRKLSADGASCESGTPEWRNQAIKTAERLERGFLTDKEEQKYLDSLKAGASGKGKDKKASATIDNAEFCHTMGKLLDIPPSSGGFLDTELPILKAFINVLAKNEKSIEAYMALSLKVSESSMLAKQAHTIRQKAFSLATNVIEEKRKAELQALKDAEEKAEAEMIAALNALEV